VTVLEERDSLSLSAVFCSEPSNSRRFLGTKLTKLLKKQDEPLCFKSTVAEVEKILRGKGKWGA
jgi:hypothetical protein